MNKSKFTNQLFRLAGTIVVMLLLLFVPSISSFGANIGDTVQFYREESWSSVPYTLVYFNKADTSNIAYCLESNIAPPQTKSGLSFKSFDGMSSYSVQKSGLKKYEDAIAKAESQMKTAKSNMTTYKSRLLSYIANNGIKFTFHSGTSLQKTDYILSRYQRVTESHIISYSGMNNNIPAQYASKANQIISDRKRTVANQINSYTNSYKSAERSYNTAKSNYDSYTAAYNKLKAEYDSNEKPTYATSYKYVNVTGIHAGSNATVKNKIVAQESNIKLVLSRAYPVLSLAEFKATTGYNSSLTLMEYKLAAQQAVYTLANGSRFTSYETAANVSSHINQQRVKEVTAILLSGITSYTGYANDATIRNSLGIDYSKFDKNQLASSVTMKQVTDKIVRNKDGSIETGYEMTYYGKNATTLSLSVVDNGNKYLDNKKENVSVISGSQSSTTALNLTFKPGETKKFTIKVTNPSDYGKLTGVVKVSMQSRSINNVMFLAAQNGYGKFNVDDPNYNPNADKVKGTYTSRNNKEITQRTVTYSYIPGKGGGSWVSAVNIQDLVSPTPTNSGFEKTVDLEWLAENGSISFKKVDQDGKICTGAIFQITCANKEDKDLTDADFSEVKVIDEGTDKAKGVVRVTNKEGQIFKLNKLPLGTYLIKEIEAPVGYIKSNNTYSLTISGTDNVKALSDVAEADLFNGAIINRKIVMDLALEKWVSSVAEPDNTKTYGARNKYDADVEGRKGNIYVAEGDIVTYKIRIFNHGNVAATAEEITDTIANGLEFIPDNETNKKYGWFVGEDGKVHTNYLKNEWITSHSGTETIGTAHKGYNYNSKGTENVAESCDEKCNYLDVEIAFKVKNLDEIDKIINVAEITKYKSSYDGHKAWTVEKKDEKTGEIIKEEYKAQDIDSTEKNHPDNHNFEDESSTGENGRNKGDYYREDDEDIAVVIPQRFDLALEKWVSQVIRKDEAGTEKSVYSNGKNTDDNNVEGRLGDIKVRSGDTVVYTIRLYNEGNIDGYVQEIMDSAPEGLEFINPDETEDAGTGFELNKLYMWEVSDGVLKTKFLSRENEEGLKEEPEKAPESDPEKKDDKEEDKKEDADKNDETKDEDKEKPNETLSFVESMKKNGLIKALSTSADASKEEKDQSEFYKMFKNGTMLKAHEKGTSHVGYNYNKGENEAKPCDKCDYKEVRIAFRVANDASKKADENGRIINLAQITKALSVAVEKTGDEEVKYEEIKDIDSTPDNHGEFVEGETREDDEDIAVIIPEIFDLALRKWIRSYDKTVAGNTENVTTTQDHTSTLDEKTGEKLVKIDLDYKKLDTTEIKINYAIRVENQGNIAGYVKELQDFIPNGTEFYIEDNLDPNGNPYWVLDGDDVIITSEGYEKEMNTLMNPGDAQFFYVTLRWITDENNTTLKTNRVEISKDYNEWNTPDVDSTPGNMIERINDPDKWEDEEDAVPFLLTVRTGEWMINFGIILAVLAAGLVTLIILRKKAANKI